MSSENDLQRYRFPKTLTQQRRLFGLPLDEAIPTLPVVAWGVGPICADPRRDASTVLVALRDHDVQQWLLNPRQGRQVLDKEYQLLPVLEQLTTNVINHVLDRLLLKGLRNTKHGAQCAVENLL